MNRIFVKNFQLFQNLIKNKLNFHYKATHVKQYISKLINSIRFIIFISLILIKIQLMKFIKLNKIK